MKQEGKRLSINVIAQVVTFSVQMIISFLLTPFIIRKLGADAYGYIGLTDSFVMYAQVIVIALNSMAGRFVTIAYHQNKMDEAKRLFSSVFYSNLTLAVIFLLVSFCCVYWLECIVNIPARLVNDVKLLFMLMFVNFMISIIFSTYQVATFIKNRLELNAIRSILSNLAKVSLLLICFGFFIPHLWYMGLAAIVSSMYIAFTNIRYTRMLTPELGVSFSCFDFSRVKILVSAGVWNSVTKLGNLLGQGLDLLFANLFIDAFAMGYLSITKKIPVIILGLVCSVCAAFAPSMTKLYAQGDMNNLKKELIFSVRFAGFICVFPTCFVFAMGDCFYNLWVPGQNAQELYVLTILGTLCNPLAMSLEGVQNIFTITNKVRTYSLFALAMNLGMFFTLFLCVDCIPYEYRIYFLASVHTFWAFFRVAFFLPMYGAKCVGESKIFFYPVMLRVVGALSVSTGIMYLYKIMFVTENWISLIIALAISCVVCAITGFFVIFNGNDRQKVKTMMVLKLRRH